jgi:hypothetical protein
LPLRPTVADVTELRRYQLIIGGVLAWTAVCGLVVVHFLGAETPAVPIVVAIVVAALAAAVASVLLGRLRPLPAGLVGPAGAHMAVNRFRTALFVPAAVLVITPMVGMTVAYLIGTAMPYLLSWAICATMLAVWVFPTRRKVAAAEAVLNSSGGVSALRATVDPAIVRAD